MKRFAMLIRREFWEHRGGFVWTPFAIAVLLAVLQLMGLALAGGAQIRMAQGPAIEFGADFSGLADKSEAAQAFAINNALSVVATPFLLALGVVLLFYFLGCLYDERKDRSILFWRSLPVRDSVTVLSKLAAGIVAAPLVYLAAILAAQLAIALMLGGYEAFFGAGEFFPMLFRSAEPFSITLHLVLGMAISSLWLLPFIAWLMFASAIAPRTPFLIAGLPLFFLVLIEQFMDAMGMLPWDAVVLDHVVLHISRAIGAITPFGIHWQGLDQPLSVRVGRFFGSNHLQDLQLWLGVIFGAAVIAATVWVRRIRSEA